MRGWGSKDRSLDNLSDKLDRLEEEREVKPVEDKDANDFPYGNCRRTRTNEFYGEVCSLVQLARKRNYAL
ncbi:MAG: hypothetical protein ACRD8Z_05490, partial [Nitrososphaeraceae archaeon]